jgi:uncharacterized GH25 family protein
MERITSANIGRQLAVVFDGKLVSAPVIRTTIRSHAVIAGRLSRQEAESIIAAVRQYTTSKPARRSAEDTPLAADPMGDANGSSPDNRPRSEEGSKPATVLRQHMRGADPSTQPRRQASATSAVLIRPRSVDVPFALHTEIPVDLVAGTAEHPRLAEVKWVRLEANYATAYGITARVGWSTARDSMWRVTVQALDRQGAVLRHPTDHPLIFEGRRSGTAQQDMQHSELQVPWMHRSTGGRPVSLRVSLEATTDRGMHAPPAARGDRVLNVRVVHAETGEPLPGATVGVVLDDTDRKMTIAPALYATDARGSCAVELPSGAMLSVSIFAQKDGFVAVTKIWSNAPAPLVVVPTSHTIHLKPALPIGGLVYNEASEPIAGATVGVMEFLSSEDGLIRIERTVQTDSNGRWRLDGVPGDVKSLRLKLTHPEYLCDVGYGRRLTGDTLGKARALVHVEVMEAGLILAGKVLDGDGKPIEGASVVLGTQSERTVGGYTRTWTDASGQFRFANAQWGVGLLRVQATSFAPTIQTVHIASGIQPVEVRLERGRPLLGRVTDARGAPVRNAMVVVAPLPDYSGFGVWVGPTDEQGRFRMANVPEHEVLVHVMKTGYTSVRDQPVKPSEAEAVLTLRAPLRVTGSVTDAVTGAPMRNFEVAICVAHKGGKTVCETCMPPVRFSDGRYELTFDEPSMKGLVLRAQAEGYEPVLSPPFDNDREERTIDLKLTPK